MPNTRKRKRRRTEVTRVQVAEIGVQTDDAGDNSLTNTHQGGDTSETTSFAMSVNSEQNQGMQRPNVVFFVAMDKNKGPLDGQVLQYQRVLLNQGSGYNPTSGMFTAPSAGVYVFNIAVAAQGGKTAAVQLFQTGEGEDQWVVTVWAESLPSWGTSSNTVYISLDQGQQVYLIARPNLNSYYYAHMYTTFSGHLVAPAK